VKSREVGQALAAIASVLAVVLLYSFLVNSAGRAQTVQISTTSTATTTLVTTSLWVVYNNTSTLTSTTLTVVAERTEYVTTLENSQIIGTCQEGDYSVPYPYQTSISTSTIVSGASTSYSKVTENITIPQTTVEWTTGTLYLTRVYTNGTLGYSTTTSTRYENSDPNAGVVEWVVTTCSFPSQSP
jgi:hypothetical protein